MRLSSSPARSGLGLRGCGWRPSRLLADDQHDLGRSLADLFHEHLAWGVYEPIGRALGESPTAGDLLDDHHGHRFSSLGPYFFPRGDVKREYLSGGPGRAAVSQLLFSGRNSRERCIAPVP